MGYPLDMFGLESNKVTSTNRLLSRDRLLTNLAVSIGLIVKKKLISNLSVYNQNAWNRVWWKTNFAPKVVTHPTLGNTSVCIVNNNLFESN